MKQKKYKNIQAALKSLKYKEFRTATNNETGEEVPIFTTDNKQVIIFTNKFDNKFTRMIITDFHVTKILNLNLYLKEEFKADEEKYVKDFLKEAKVIMNCYKTDLEVAVVYC